MFYSDMSLNIFSKSAKIASVRPILERKIEKTLKTTDH